MELLKNSTKERLPLPALAAPDFIRQYIICTGQHAILYFDQAGKNEADGVTVMFPTAVGSVYGCVEMYISAAENAPRVFRDGNEVIGWLQCHDLMLDFEEDLGGFTGYHFGISNKRGEMRLP